MPSTETIMAHTEFTLRIKQSHPYAGRPIAFLTQHGKEQVVSPILNKALGCQIERVSGFNTDELGTFTRDMSFPRFFVCQKATGFMLPVFPVAVDSIH